MKRREFISLLSGAVAWPLEASAQQRDQIPHVGVLMATTETDADGQSRWNVFRKRLNELGWIEDRNLRFDIRWAGGDIERFREYAAALAQAKPDVILADATPSTAALLHETRTVPIVFVRVSDPAGQGFVKNLARPDGNVTGFTNFEPQLAGKWVQLLKDLVPNLAHVSFIYNPQTAPYTGPFMHSFEAAARELGIKAIVKPILQSTDIDALIAERHKEPSAGLVVQTDAFMVNHRDLIVAAAARYKVPAIYPVPLFARNGGLAAYGIQAMELYRDAALYVDRILKGAKPGELPVQAPTKYELVINLKTAKALGLEIPLTLLARADEVIE
jgi:putative ABC transport system substrate-binding protein